MKISQSCEVWAVIDGFTRYEVSTRGRVRVRATGKIMSPDLSTEYPSVRLVSDITHKKKHKHIHFLEAVAFLPDRSQCVNHIDGDKTNNHISNLEWCTYAENNKHAYDMGLKKPYQQRISNKERIHVGEMLRNGMTPKEIAKQYGVTDGCIYQLIKRGQVSA